jgi:HEPN domain-containing protein
MQLSTYLTAFYCREIEMTDQIIPFNGNDSGIIRSRFTRRGFEYYIAARFCFLSRFGDIAGILVHHAVEMFLKGGLSKFKNYKEIKKNGHCLTKLWLEYLELSGKNEKDESVMEITNQVSSIDSFENLRYPDFELIEGTIKTFEINPSTSIRILDEDQYTNKFTLNLYAIDSLIIGLLESIVINPLFFIVRYEKYDLNYLYDKNAYAIKWGKKQDEAEQPLQPDSVMARFCAADP